MLNTIILLIWIASLSLSLLTDSFKPALSPTGPYNRIVSLNISTDEIIMDLVKPERISAISTFSTNEKVSYIMDKASCITTHVIGSLEQIESVRPDFLIVTEFNNLTLSSYFTKYRPGIYYHEFKTPENLDQLYLQIMNLGKKLDVENEALSLITKTQKAITTIMLGKSRSASVLIIHSLLNVVGRNTLLNSVIEQIGLQNATYQKGIVNLTTEQFLSVKCDYIITTEHVVDGLRTDKFYRMNPALNDEKTVIIVSEKSINSLNHNIMHFVNEVAKQLE